MFVSFFFYLIWEFHSIPLPIYFVSRQPQRLTAAHCKNMENKVLWVGATRKTNSGLYRTCEDWYEDGKFDYQGNKNNLKPPFFYDFALCKLNLPVYEKDILQINSNPSWPPDPTPGLTVIGTGRLSSGGQSSNVMREVQVPLVPIGTCKRQYGTGKIRDPEIICASEGGKDACQGKSVTIDSIRRSTVRFGALVTHSTPTHPCCVPLYFCFHYSPTAPSLRCDSLRTPPSFLPS